MEADAIVSIFVMLSTIPLMIRVKIAHFVHPTGVYIVYVSLQLGEANQSTCTTLFACLLHPRVNDGFHINHSCLLEVRNLKRENNNSLPKATPKSHMYAITLVIFSSI